MLKKRTRRRTRGRKNKKLYFNDQTQAGIVEFQNTPCLKEQEKIYEKDIMPAFEKLAENLILIYGFNKYGEFTALKNDCVSFLYETLHKFDNSKGTKAFSYFNVVAKNWLILNTRRKRKTRDGHVSIYDTEKLSAHDELTIATHLVAPSPDDEMIAREKKDEIFKMLYEIQSKVEAVNDVSCIMAIITIYENIDNLDFLNKRAIYVYIRDISGLNSKQLSTSMSTIRKLYKEITGKAFKLGGLS